MARGRQSSQIKVVTGRDRDLLQQLSKTGISTASQANKYAGISSTRLNKLEKSGYVKTSNHIIRGENNRIIQLDKTGIQYCRQELGVSKLCIAQTNHLVHDIKLTEVYYKLEPHIQETWRAESELIQEYYERYPENEEKLVTCIDATIEVNGEIIAIESIGESYSNNEIELKYEIAQALGCLRMECV